LKRRARSTAGGGAHSILEIAQRRPKLAPDFAVCKIAQSATLFAGNDDR
jgi:hypothetical protein